jgi:P-type Mg2+ transporter
MLIFGPLSSLFDFATFGVLLWLMKAGEQSFQTGWFIESIFSAGIVVFAVRTRLHFTRSRPSRVMLAVTAAVILIPAWLPYSPLAEVLGFVSLSVPYVMVISGIAVVYLFSGEFAKPWFYRKYEG